jgi:2-amino-4-hydroxy-6-hydroxymethyldihydropteridine diphosphokinase
VRTGIAIGSNLGDRLANLRSAIAQLREIPDADPPWLLSPVYETDPVDSPPGVEPYYNAVAEFTWNRDPAKLLDRLQQIESRLGRPSKRPRNAPRTIDLDILYVGNLAMSTPEIVIPHPRLHLRRFVLAPLADIRPDLLLPRYHQPVRELLAQLEPNPSAHRLPDALEVTR